MKKNSMKIWAVILFAVSTGCTPDETTEETPTYITASVSNFVQAGNDFSFDYNITYVNSAYYPISPLITGVNGANNGEFLPLADGGILDYSLNDDTLAEIVNLNYTFTCTALGFNAGSIDYECLSQNYTTGTNERLGFTLLNGTPTLSIVSTATDGTAYKDHIANFGPVTVN